MKMIRLLKCYPLAGAVCLFIAYVLLYFIGEWLDLPAVITLHSTLDDRIPFFAYALYPYAGWAFEIAALLLYTYFKRDRDTFVRFVLTVWSAMTVIQLFYFVCPSEIHLRPAEVPGQGLTSDLVRLLYLTDNNKNVFPSIHVTDAVLMSLLERELFGRSGKTYLLYGYNLVVILSTMLLKQHSTWDVLAGIVCGISAYLIMRAVSRHRE